MKKMVLLALLAATTLSANAQRKKTRANTSQSNWSLRLGLGLNADTQDPVGDPSVRNTGISINPALGYFVADNLEIGVRLGIGNNRTKNDSTTTSRVETNSTSTAFGIYGQKYFPINNWFAFTTTLDVGMRVGSIENTSTNGAITTKNSTGINAYGGALNLGFAFTPVNNLAIQANIAGLGGESGVLLNESPTPDVNFSNFGFNVWRQPTSVSLVWFFGRGMWNED
jgi:hypothetical protein